MSDFRISHAVIFIVICLSVVLLSVNYPKFVKLEPPTSMVPSNSSERTNRSTPTLYRCLLNESDNLLKSDFVLDLYRRRQDCCIPQKGSRQLASTLDFIWRPKWANYYRHGCWSPNFSRIIKENKTLIIDCPDSMKPKYGFKTRGKLDHNYTGPVSMIDREWVYVQCSLPFYPEPTVRLHFLAQPLPRVSNSVRTKPNIVFIQFDALGRQALHRRMPRSYKILSTYSNNQSSPNTLTELNGVRSFEFAHLNVNGRNSEPNMRRVYCGSGNCQTTSLLKLYKSVGYSTSLMESYSYQLGNYVPNGNVDRLLASNFFGEYGSDTVELYNKRSGCVMGSTWISDQMLDYLRDRFIDMQSGGWSSINNIIDSHAEDELNNYAVLDVRFRDFLIELNNANALDNTILVVLADHGLHGHDWTELWRAYDHRNPYLQILIGRNVNLPEIVLRNLQNNIDKLITHSDIYTTFSEFSGAQLPLRLNAGINLFNKRVPENRSCRSAALPDEWCNCWVPKSIPSAKQ